MTNRREFLGVSIAGSVGIYSSVQPTGLFAKTRLAKPINSEEIKRFFKAIKNGSLPKCRAMLDANKDLLESRNPSGHSAYGYALQNSSQATLMTAEMVLLKDAFSAMPLTP